jgi:hypothetical protein
MLANLSISGARALMRAHAKSILFHHAGAKPSLYFELHASYLMDPGADVAEFADALDSKLHFEPFFPVSSAYLEHCKSLDFIGRNGVLACQHYVC